MTGETKRTPSKARRPARAEAPDKPEDASAPAGETTPAAQAKPARTAKTAATTAPKTAKQSAGDATTGGASEPAAESAAAARTAKLDQAFQRRVRTRMREGWQIVGRSDEPPRVRLRRRADMQKGRRRGPDSLIFEHVYREIWIDEGVVKDEDTPGEG